MPELLKGNARRRLEQFLHGTNALHTILLGEDIDSMEKIKCMIGEFQSFSLFVLDDEAITDILDFEVIVIVEISEYAPTNLYFEHLDTFSLKSNKTIDADCVSVLLLSLFFDYILYCSNVF